MPLKKRCGWKLSNHAPLVKIFLLLIENVFDTAKISKG